jgi:hypothetical protein
MEVAVTALDFRDNRDDSVYQVVKFGVSRNRVYLTKALEPLEAISIREWRLLMHVLKVCVDAWCQQWVGSLVALFVTLIPHV